jgi:Toastrack DUF4097/zinc-ribbon domain
MPLECQNCGAEIGTGQRFCRRCGKPTGTLPGGQVPSQFMPPPQPGATAPTLNADTRPVSGQTPTYYQPARTPAPYYPAYEQPRKGSWGWIVALVGIGLFGVVVLGILLVAHSFRMNRGRIPITSLPGIPQQPGEVLFAADNAKRFPFSASSTLTIKNINGDVSIEAWDEPDAEVTVIKHGGSSQDRSETGVLISVIDGNLSLRSSPGRSSGVEVEYRVKLPRQVGRIEISGINTKVNISDVVGPVAVNTINGAITMSDVSGALVAETKNGSINLRDVSGSATTKSMSGNTTASFTSVTEGEPLQFSSVSGNIDVQFANEINAVLGAKTVSGTIDLDEDLGIKVDKRIVGARASGRLGSGGPSLDLVTISGNIKVSR